MDVIFVNIRGTLRTAFTFFKVAQNFLGRLVSKNPGTKMTMKMHFFEYLYTSIQLRV